MTTHELSVPAALSGKRVLLTGATGFLAKVVLEKLIRTVPDLDGVILLIRGGEAGDARARFQRQIAASSIFDRCAPSAAPGWSASLPSRSSA
jgi:fatty acyl-CoA reductase